MRLLKAHDRGVLSPHVVAEQLARFNLRVARADKTRTVSERCIVVWRPRDGGGGQCWFNGTQLDQESSFPVMSRGLDVVELVNIYSKHALPRFIAKLRQQQPPEIDRAAINADLAKMPDMPDDSLE